MKGIRLSHGAVFVTDGLHTVRLLPSGQCGPSPIAYPVLEWDLRCENPNSWEYLTNGDIEGLDGYDKIFSAFEDIYKVEAGVKNGKV